MLAGRVNVGTFGCGQDAEEWPMPLADGDMGGVKGDITAETEDGDPGMSPIAAAISIAAEDDRGEGTAEPVDT